MKPRGPKFCKSRARPDQLVQTYPVWNKPPMPPPIRPVRPSALLLLAALSSFWPGTAPGAPARSPRASTGQAPARASLRAQPRTAVVPPAAGCILIAATNDVHGALAPYTVASADARGAVSAGGALAMSAYVDRLRALSDGRLIVLDAGDIFQGTMASNLSFGAAMVETYNAIGYDAAAIGNHEFDYGSGDDPNASGTAVLQARIASAKFPFVASNIDDATSDTQLGWRNVHPSVLKDVGGVRVGIVGATTPTTKEATNPHYVERLNFADPAPRIAQRAAELRAAGAQLVVLLAHMGGRCDAPDDPNAIASCVQPGIDGELLRTLEAMPPGTVDVAIGGHTHNKMAHWWNQTAVIESGAQGHAFGLVQACPQQANPSLQHVGLDRSRSVIYPTQALCLTEWRDGGCGPRATAVPSRPARFAGGQLRVNAVAAKVARPYLEAVDARERASIGALLPAALSAPRVTELIAEAMRRATGSDFGVQNRGGVRTSIAAGAVTYRQVFEAVPFDNHAAVLTLSGSELNTLARALVGDRPVGLWPEFTGLRVAGRGAGLHLLGKNDAPLQDDARYTLCTTDFVLNGGDGAGPALAHLEPERVRQTQMTMRDALVRLLRELYPNPIAEPATGAVRFGP